MRKKPGTVTAGLFSFYMGEKDGCYNKRAFDAPPVF